MKSSKEVVLQVGGLGIVEKEPFEKKVVEIYNGIGIIFGLTGKIKGQVIINLSEETGKKIASYMMDNIPIITIDEMTINKLSELSNMILASAVTQFYSSGIALDITPPSILYGKEISYLLVDNDITCIPFETNGESIEINLALKTIKNK